MPDGAPLYLPFTLPGELVRPGTLARRGQGWTAPTAVLDPSPVRVAAPCPHFGICGGCSMQHMAEAAYLAWKAGLVADALDRLGHHAPLPPLARTGPGRRRRMDLAIHRAGGGVQIGLHAHRSDQVVDMRACPVLHPALFALVGALRPVLARLDGLRREGSALVNLLDTGPDLLLRTDRPLTAVDRAALAGLAGAHGWPRIAWAAGPRDTPEPACTLGPVRQVFSGRAVPVPPGAFLQASAEGEAAIVAAVLAALPERRKRSHLVELFAGCGTITHALPGRVVAYESDPAAVTALRAAANPSVSAVLRDLHRQPLQSSEFKGAAAVVLDPPWAGAAPQMPALARAGLPVVYVSCNPPALARDGRVLIEAGYRVVHAAAIDQFLWSARVEAVVGFAR